jgi:hypothetical protein
MSLPRLSLSKRIALVTTLVATGSICATMFVLTRAQATSPATLPAPWKQLPLPAFTMARAFPIISNGRLLSFPRTLAMDGSTVITLWDLSSGGSSQLALSAPSLSRITVHAMAITAAQTLLVAGSYEENQDSSIRNGLLSFDMLGHLLAFVDLGGYTPQRMCTSQDGSIWLVGQAWNQELSANGGAYSLLQHYASDMTLESSYLPRTGLPSARTIDLNPPGRVFGHDGTVGFLSCGVSSVGFFLGTPFSLWTEVSSGGIVKQLQLSHMPGSSMTGLLLAQPATVYATFAIASHQRLYTLVPTSSTNASWEPMGTYNPDTAQRIHIIGEDQNSVVYITGSVSPPGLSTTLYWSRF